MCVDGFFPRSSINIAGSDVSGAGDSAVVTIQPKMQQSEVAAAVPNGHRWLMPVARVTGVNGFRPTFVFSNYTSSNTTQNSYWGAPWQSGRRPMFSYDMVTWTHFDTNVTIGSTTITFRNSTAFTQDPVYISWGRTWTNAQLGAWINTLAGTYPTLVKNVPSNVSGFRSGTFSAQTDILGGVIQPQPFYAFKINDTSLGSTKKVAVFLSGVHAGEDQGDLVAKAAIEFLCTSATEAVNVRTNFDIYYYSMINAPGRMGGGWRGSWTLGSGNIDDANRHFSDVSPGLEIVTIPRNAMIADLPSVTYWLDSHGDFGSGANSFGYYPDGSMSLSNFNTAISSFGITMNNFGALPSGATPEWAKNTYGTSYAISIETSDAVPLADSDITNWGQVQIKALSYLINMGQI